MLINYRNLTLNIPCNKHKDLLNIMLTDWNSSCKILTLRKIASLLGLITKLDLIMQWENNTYIALQHAVPFALKFNSNTVLANRKYKHLIDLPASKNINIKNFFLSKYHKTV